MKKIQQQLDKLISDLTSLRASLQGVKSVASGEQSSIHPENAIRHRQASRLALLQRQAEKHLETMRACEKSATLSPAAEDTFLRHANLAWSMQHPRRPAKKMAQVLRKCAVLEESHREKMQQAETVHHVHR